MSETIKKYIEAVGRRKTSVARARLTPSSKSAMIINDKTVEAYFKVAELIEKASEAVKTAKVEQKFSVSIKVSGGGISSQAEAVRHAISRALVDYDLNTRKDLKKAGFLKRDPRAKERRKFGLKKARKAPQWSKR